MQGGMFCLLRRPYLKCFQAQQQKAISYCESFCQSRIQNQTFSLPRRRLPERNCSSILFCLKSFSTETNTPPIKHNTNDDKLSDVKSWPTPVDFGKRIKKKRKHTIYVGTYDYNFDNIDLKAIFSQFGAVKHVEIPFPKHPKEFKMINTYQYAWVTFYEEDCYQRALLAQQIQVTLGKTLSIEKAVEMSREEQSERRIGFSGFNFTYDIPYLKDLFSQFGEVLRCEVYQKKSYFGNRVSKGDGYVSGYIVFREKKSVLKALSVKIVPTYEGKSLDVQEYSYISKDLKFSLQQRTYFIDGLPEGITVHQIYNHFIYFGSIDLINLVSDIRLKKDPTVKINFAFIQLKEQSHNILIEEHMINGSLLQVKKSRELCKASKCKIVKLTCLPNDITESDLQSHFSTYGNIRNVSISNSDGEALIWFGDSKEAMNAVKNPIHEIKGEFFDARLQGLRLE